jgi:hypothetical protein
MKTYWILTYLDENDQLARYRYDDEDSAREAWYITPFALKLEEVHLLESNI